MINIRIASECDVPLLPEIERSASEIFRQWPGLEWIADDDVQSTEQHRALIAEGVVFVADLPGVRTAAFLNGEVTRDALHIWQMAVHRDQQGRGIGRRLVAAAKQFATEHEVNALTLTTFKEVPWNEPYYQKLGFITLGYEDLGSRLRGVLDAEEQAGLPAARRCAMRKPL